jgi:uncharacterized membrane protein
MHISTTPNSAFMENARNTLEGKWGLAIATSLVLMVITTCIQLIPIAGWAIALLITGSLSVGFAGFFLALNRRQEASVGMLFDSFKTFDRGLIAYLLILVYVILWLLLLIIPGIIAAYSYALTYFIIADDAISAQDAITKSKEMMKGHKWKYFCLQMRFIGWFILCIFSFGIGFLWLVPYMMASFTEFYLDLKQLHETNPQTLVGM